MASVSGQRDSVATSSPGRGASSVISLRRVSKVYRLGNGETVAAVRDLSLDVERGEFIVVTGRSGSGKTTLLNLAAGLIKPTSGEVLVDGVSITSLPDRQQSLLRNRKIGFVFQFPSLLPSLTAVENVALPAMFGPRDGKESPYERAVYLLELVGLAQRLDAYPRQLSAGQQKRVVIARAMMNRPQIILADEATADLDEQTEREIMDLLQEVHAKLAVTILLVTHSRELVTYATRSLRMGNGELVDQFEVAARQD